ncbi:MAG: hypothetical protein WCT20_02050 [Candidatus Babeliales bacterium]
MKKVGVITIAGLILGYGFLAAACAELPNDEETIRRMQCFSITLERYKKIICNDSDIDVTKEGKALVQEARDYFSNFAKKPPTTDEQTDTDEETGTAEEILAPDKQSLGIQFFHYLENYCSLHPIAYEKIIKFYLFTLDSIAKNPDLEKNAIIAAVLFSFFDFSPKKASLDRIEFYYEESKPVMRYASNNNPSIGIYDVTHNYLY